MAKKNTTTTEVPQKLDTVISILQDSLDSSSREVAKQIVDDLFDRGKAKMKLVLLAIAHRRAAKLPGLIDIMDKVEEKLSNRLDLSDDELTNFDLISMARYITASFNSIIELLQALSLDPKVLGELGNEKGKLVSDAEVVEANMGLISVVDQGGRDKVRRIVVGLKSKIKQMEAEERKKLAEDSLPTNGNSAKASNTPKVRIRKKSKRP